MVGKAWNTPVTGSPGFVWERKLKNTKRALKEWAKETIKHLSYFRRELCNNLLSNQIEMDHKTILKEDLDEEAKLQTKVY